MAITVVTPTTMPRIVSAERSLYARIAPMAKPTFAARPRWNAVHSIRMPRSLLMAQGLHGRQLGRGGRRSQSRHQPRERTRQQAEGHEAGLERGREDLA